MTTREALFAAVCVAPDADLPRLVLADHFDEQGEHERAEFVRLQILTARHGTRQELADRLAELRRDPAALLDPIDRDAFERGFYTPVFERGFLSAVSFPNCDPFHYDPPLFPENGMSNEDTLTEGSAANESASSGTVHP